MDKIDKDWEYFFDRLKSAICLMGGVYDDRWAEYEFKYVFYTLLKNGIRFYYPTGMKIEEITLKEMYYRLYGPYLHDDEQFYFCIDPVKFNERKFS